jgi:hypothetical protein
VEEVWEAANQAIERARSGGGATFLHASCVVHLEGHFLGYQLLRMTREPVRELPGMAAPLMGAFLRLGGASLSERAAGLRDVLSTLPTTLRDPRREPDNDPLVRTRTALESDAARLSELEDAIEREIAEVVSTALQESAP